jgi:hypothetical protein
METLEAAFEFEEYARYRIKERFGDGQSAGE